MRPSRPACPPPLLAAALLIPLAGCGTASPWAALTEPWAALADRFTPPEPLARGGQEEPPAAAGGGRALRLGLAGRGAATAALLQELGERRLWRTDAGFVVATEGARVVATSGQREVLAATRFDGPDPLAQPAALRARGGAAARRLVDLTTADRDPRGMRFGVELDCRLRAGAAPGEDEDVLLVEERCRAGAAAGGGFTNRFWVEEGSGAVLRSEQWIGPGLPPLVVEPAAPAPG